MSNLRRNRQLGVIGCCASRDFNGDLFLEKRIEKEFQKLRQIGIALCVFGCVMFLYAKIGKHT